MIVFQKVVLSLNINIYIYIDIYLNNIVNGNTDIRIYSFILSFPVVKIYTVNVVVLFNLEDLNGQENIHFAKMKTCFSHSSAIV